MGAAEEIGALSECARAVYDVLVGMRDELRARRRKPEYIALTAVLRECAGVGRDEACGALNELYLRGRIKVARGINDKLIRVVERG